MERGEVWSGLDRAHRIVHARPVAPPPPRQRLVSMQIRGRWGWSQADRFPHPPTLPFARWRLLCSPLPPAHTHRAGDGAGIGRDGHCTHTLAACRGQEVSRTQTAPGKCGLCEQCLCLCLRRTTARLGLAVGVWWGESCSILLRLALRASSSLWVGCMLIAQDVRCCSVPARTAHLGWLSLKRATTRDESA